jgi:hypothetical protein
VTLREEVAEIFSESERPGLSDFDGSNLAVDNETARGLTYESSWLAQAANAPAERWACPHCGGVVELKAGMKHPVHMGKRVEILPPCKAIWRSREQA